MKAISNKDSNPYDRPERLEFCLEQRRKHPPEPFIDPTVDVPYWVKYGSNVTMHMDVKFTEGFGFARTDRTPTGVWLHIPHTGRVIIGDYVEIYPDTTINRGTIEDTTIGIGTKIDHKCHIGHNSKIGRNCIICAGVIIAGGAVIGDNVWIGPGSKILNKKIIAKDCYVAQGANVVSDMLQEHCMIMGNPAKSEYREHLPHNKIG